MVAGRVQPPYLKNRVRYAEWHLPKQVSDDWSERRHQDSIVSQSFIQSKVQNIFSIILGNYKSELVLRIEIGNITYRQSKKFITGRNKNRVRYFLFSTTGSFCVSDKLSNTSSIRLSRLNHGYISL